MNSLTTPPSTRGHHPLFQLVRARILEFGREPAAIFWVYGFPMIMMVALGIAFRNRPIESIEIDVQQGPQGETIRTALVKDPRFKVHVNDRETCLARLRSSKSALLVVGGETATAGYEYYFDPTQPGSVLARNAVDDALQRAAGRQDSVPASDHEVNEPGGRYIDFLVPGLLGMGLMGGGLWGVGFAIVDLRIRRLLKRYLATPMKRGHFMAAMMISRLLFTVPEILALLIFARLFFGVVNHGSYLAIVLLVVMGAFEFAGIGLLVASRAQTLETVSGLMNLVMLPMWIASGVFYSIERFPEAVHPLLKALPLTPLIDALRGVMQDGASLATLGPQLGIMSAWGLLTFVLALRWFRWT